jgi:hypothetical protein
VCVCGYIYIERQTDGMNVKILTSRLSGKRRYGSSVYHSCNFCKSLTLF